MNCRNGLVASSGSRLKLAARRLWLRIIFLTAAVALFASICGAAHAAECLITEWHSFGWTATTSMTIRSGEGCSSGFSSSGDFAHQLYISSPPEHGTADTIGTNTWTYQSDSGYVGRDSFKVDIVIAGGRPIRLTVNVTVVERSFNGTKGKEDTKKYCDGCPDASRQKQTPSP